MRNKAMPKRQKHETIEDVFINYTNFMIFYSYGIQIYIYIYT